MREIYISSIYHREVFFMSEPATKMTILAGRAAVGLLSFLAGVISVTIRPGAPFRPRLFSLFRRRSP
jgi:hypothetical protein